MTHTQLWAFQTWNIHAFLNNVGNIPLSQNIQIVVNVTVMTEYNICQQCSKNLKISPKKTEIPEHTKARLTIIDRLAGVTYVSTHIKSDLTQNVKPVKPGFNVDLDWIHVSPALVCAGMFYFVSKVLGQNQNKSYSRVNGFFPKKGHSAVSVFRSLTMLSLQADVFFLKMTEQTLTLTELTNQEQLNAAKAANQFRGSTRRRKWGGDSLELTILQSHMYTWSWCKQPSDI